MENNGKIISKETLELRRAGKNIKKGTEDLAKYVKEVAKKTPLGQGRIDIVKHKLIDNKVVAR